MSEQKSMSSNEQEALETAWLSLHKRLIEAQTELVEEVERRTNKLIEELRSTVFNLEGNGPDAS